VSTTRIGIVTKEWPPAVYGGAGVHVVQLTEALRKVSGITGSMFIALVGREMMAPSVMKPLQNSSQVILLYKRLLQI
jgi:hypothetical protein